ncbi:hypothetical protein EYC84_001010 [Monilinia fructicola]|uniref:BTB domain-containing protein n=1 Tax=Monilinia fructicola TaxID=38448 RepID=A0A5M9JL43_MONFR|nr:hypothetical protein EYC84_001010 [Monilinia fructicola]
MVSDTSEVSEKLVFDTKGDVLLVFTRRCENEEIAKGSPSKSSNLKRKSPHDVSNTITMLVSSKHMALASPVFDAMLAHEKFREGLELKASAKVEIALPDDDPVAFEILAGVIHHRNKSIPKSVSFELLTKLAVLTEKYLMHETLHIVSQVWLLDNSSGDHSISPSGQTDCRGIYPPAIKNARGEAFGEVFSALNGIIVQRIRPHSLTPRIKDSGPFLKNLMSERHYPSSSPASQTLRSIHYAKKTAAAANRANFEGTTLRENRPDRKPNLRSELGETSRGNQSNACMPHLHTSSPAVPSRSSSTNSLLPLRSRHRAR